MARRERLLLIIAGSIVALLIAAYIALSVWATLVVKGDFYDALDMGDGVHEALADDGRPVDRRCLLLAAIIAAPLLFLGTGGAARGRRPPPPGPHPGEMASEEVLEAWTARREAVLEWELAGGRRGARRTGAVPWPLVIAGWAGLTLILTLAIGGRLAAARDTLLAATQAVNFGVDDPIFGLDVSFHVFMVPAVTIIVSAIFSALILALIAVIATGVLVVARRDRPRPRPARPGHRRAHDHGRLHLRRPDLHLRRRAGVVRPLQPAQRRRRHDRRRRPGGARGRHPGAHRGRRRAAAHRHRPASPSRVPSVRERARPRVRGAVYVTAGTWIAISVVLAVLASPWLILLALPAVALGYATIRAAEQDADLATYPVPFWSWPVLAVATAIVVTLAVVLLAAVPTDGTSRTDRPPPPERTDRDEQHERDERPAPPAAPHGEPLRPWRAHGRETTQPTPVAEEGSRGSQGPRADAPGTRRPRPEGPVPARELAGPRPRRQPEDLRAAPRGAGDRDAGAGGRGHRARCASWPWRGTRRPPASTSRR